MEALEEGPGPKKIVKIILYIFLFIINLTIKLKTLNQLFQGINLLDFAFDPSRIGPYAISVAEALWRLAELRAFTICDNLLRRPSPNHRKPFNSPKDNAKISILKRIFYEIFNYLKILIFLNK